MTMAWESDNPEGGGGATLRGLILYLPTIISNHNSSIPHTVQYIYIHAFGRQILAEKSCMDASTAAYFKNTGNTSTIACQFLFYKIGGWFVWMCLICFI